MTDSRRKKVMTERQLRKENQELFAKASAQFKARTGKALAVDLPAGQGFGTNTVREFSQILAENKISLSELQEDAKALHAFLTPAATISRGKDQKDIQEKNGSDTHPDAFFIFGNNDLKQVEHMANLYRTLKPKMIFISGKGGHGTVPGPIFGLTEAETMARALKELGVPKDRIVTEREATNSGANITLTDKIMAGMGDNLFQHILISGTPAGIMRQLRSYEKQSKHAWASVSALPPAWNEIQREYYGNKQDAIINILCAMREMGSFLDYTLNSEYMSSRVVPNEAVLNQAIHTFVKYFNLLTTGEKIDANKITADFNKAMKQKAEGGIDSALKVELGAKCQEMANYFRVMFMLVEQHTMKQLPKNITSTEQAQLIDLQRRYSKLGVDAPRALGLFSPCRVGCVADAKSAVLRPLSPGKAG